MNVAHEDGPAVTTLHDLIAGASTGETPELQEALRILCERAEQGFFDSRQSAGTLKALAKELLQSVSTERTDAP